MVPRKPLEENFGFSTDSAKIHIATTMTAPGNGESARRAAQARWAKAKKKNQQN